MADTRSDTGTQRREPLLSVNDVGLWLCMSRAGVYRLIRKGELLPIYVDSRPRFASADVEGFISSRRQTGAR